jgi:hypothetical protein
MYSGVRLDCRVKVELKAVYIQGGRIPTPHYLSIDVACSKVELCMRQYHSAII